MVSLLCWNAVMLQMLSHARGARRLLGEAQALLDGPGLAGEDVSFEQAHCSMQTGYATLATDPGTTRVHMTESLELYRQIDHRWGMAYALTGLGRAVVRLGDLEGAREAFTRSLSYHEEVENRVGQTEALEELAEVVLWQSLFEEAEDLIQQALALTPATNRIGIAVGLGLLGEVQLKSGRFAKAQSTIEACLPIWEEVGLRVWVAKRTGTLAWARLHVGAYDAAREQAEAVIALCQELDWERGIGHGKQVLGAVALAEADPDRAYQLLQESRVCAERYSPFYGDPSAWLGLAACRLGKRAEARGYLSAALDWVEQYERSIEQMTALAATALLLADEGEAERGVELYALALRYPYVANSCWFEEVIGRHIAAAAAALPAGIAEAARERGRERDLAATLEEIRQELAGRQNVARQRAQAPEMETGDGHE
jgi:tetratricopeptide (TPR) repeat protein